MTVSSTTNKARFNGAGSTGPFPFDFKTFVTTDLDVIQTDALGAEALLVLTTDYTVSLNADQNNDPGGEVTLVAPLPVGEVLTLLRSIDALQDTDITNAGGFYPEVVEDALDRLTMLAQQNAEAIDRAVKVPVSSVADPDQLIADINQAVSDAATYAAAAAQSTSDADAARVAAEAAQAAAETSAGEAAVIASGIQTQLATRFTVGGTADEITGTLSPAIASYAAGLRVTTTPGGANTVAAPTLALNGLTARTIKKRGSGGTKVALVAGDYNASGPFDFEYDGTDFILMNPLAVASSSQHGQCRLTKSGANLLLQPFNGNKLVINGGVQTIPAAGVSLAPPATSGTTYLIYAYMNGATMTLEYSATGHATDSTTGVEIKSGDATRTLVGMARTVSSAWVDSQAQRFVISYFNRRPIISANFLTGTAATSSGSFVELNSSYRAEYLTWGDSAVQAGGAGAATHNTATYVANYYAAGVDGATAAGPYTQFTTPGTGVVSNGSCISGVSQSEGYHYVTPMGATSSGTVTFQVNYTNVSAMVQG